MLFAYIFSPCFTLHQLSDSYIKNIVKFRFSLCVRTFSLALHLFLFIPEIANDMYKAIIKQKDLDDSSLAAIVSIAESSEGIHSDERQIATEVKQAVESKLTGTWQVVVGRTFGSCVHHEDGCFAYLYVGRYKTIERNHS